MDLTQIVVVTAAVISVIGLTIFLVKRSNLLQLSVKHNLNPELTETVEHVSAKLGAVVEPVAKGVGDIGSGIGGILHSIADRIGVKQKEFSALQSQFISLAQEIERLKNRQINVTDVMAQLKLALIGVDQSYTSLMRANIEMEKEGVITGGSSTEYLGLRTARYRIQIGVDIEKLEFQLTDDNHILVYGLRRPVIVGLDNLRFDHHLDEIRKHTEKGAIFSTARSEILKEDGRIKDYMPKHLDRIHQEIQQSQSIQHLKEPNARLALAFLQACFSSGGYEVEESKDPFLNPLRFSDLCLEINRMVATRIDATTTQLLAIEGESRRVESEMLVIASGRKPDSDTSCNL